MDKDVRFLVECLSTELAQMLMRDYSWDIDKALDVLYSSNTYTLLENPQSGLYYQGAVYVYGFLQEEINK